MGTTIGLQWDRNGQSNGLAANAPEAADEALEAADEAPEAADEASHAPDEAACWKTSGGAPATTGVPASIPLEALRREALASESDGHHRAIMRVAAPHVSGGCSYHEWCSATGRTRCGGAASPSEPLPQHSSHC